jgi:hypothetical protein
MNGTDHLERALTDLGAHIDAPRDSDIASAVRRRIEASPARRLPMRPWVWTRRTVVFAVVLVLLASSIAVASYLAVRGVRIRVGETPPPAATPTAPVGTALGLGERSTLAAARAELAFPVRVPEALGAPDEVYLGRFVPGYQVTLLYRPRSGLPEARGTKAGLLLFQFAARVDRHAFDKFVAPGQIRNVTVAGAPGIWIEGTHTVAWLDPAGNLMGDTVRLSDNVLLWQLGRVTLRLESALPMQDAIRIAASVR